VDSQAKNDPIGAGIASLIEVSYISTLNDMRKRSMKRDLVNVFKSLSDPNRIRMVKMLEEKELCVCEIRSILGLSNSTASKHLSILRDAGLIVDSKDGKWVNFRLNEKADSPLVRGALKLVRNSFGDQEDVLTDRKAIRTVNRKAICGV
jgi:ArsR family transcriptional regulator, arsenate/arsenite/antimonite-responsive transcriptional repressor